MAAPTSERRGTRRSADVTREAILVAALDLFSETSFDRATTRDIASRAGVTQPLLNYHFKTKDELWRTAVDALFRSLSVALAERSEGLRGVDDLTTARLLVREFIVFSARNPQLHRIISQECKVDGPRMDYLVEHHVRPMYEMTAELVARLTEQGHLPPIPAAHLFYVLTAAGPAMFVLAPECRRLTGLDPTSEDVIEAHVNVMLSLLFGFGRSRG